jgi:hypothetical protein
MTQSSPSEQTIAAVCDRNGPDAARMEAFLESVLESQSRPARWYALRDLDDVDREACAGRVPEVVFVRWEALLEGIWNGEVTFNRWLQAGARVHFVESPGSSSEACLATVSDAWMMHKRVRQRCQVISGIVLSIIAIASAFLLIQG